MIGQRSIGLFCICLALLMAGLYHLKYVVMDLREQNNALQYRIDQEQQALALLNAEWAYLNHPDRLAQLAEKHLQLKPLSPEHVASWQDTPHPEMHFVMQKIEAK